MAAQALLDALIADLGTARPERDDPRLRPESARLDDRDTVQLLAALRSLAPLICHHDADAPAAPPGDWRAFFPAGDEAALRARLAADARDFAARFELAALLAHRGSFAAAFDELLEVVLRDKGEQREAARVRMVEWFTLCTDSAVVDKARRRLAMYLN